MSTPPSSPADLPPEEPTPIDTLLGPGDRSQTVRRIPRAALAAIETVRQAAPRTLYTAVALEVAASAILAIQLLITKHLINGLLVLGRDPHASVSGVIPSFIGILAATVVAGLLNAMLNHQKQLLNELVSLRVIDQIIGVATEVELARFEDSAFYDQLERASTAGVRRPTEIVNSLMAVLLGLLSSAGVIIVLFTLEPILVPLVVIASVPVLFAALHNSRKAYMFEYAMTTHARERLHLYELFVEREPAKELRVFSATGFLRHRYDALTEERVRRMRLFLRERLRVSMAAVLVGALGAAIALGSLIWLLATGRADVATAATAAIAMQVLTSQLTGVTRSVAQLVESSLFLDDLQKFLAMVGKPASTASVTESPRAEAPPFDSLRVENLTFTYPNTQARVLDDVSLEINRGEVVALVGENGSGKTTLVKLLCQLYAAQDGQIRWNGTDVGELDPETLRSHMTVLFQDFVRYHLSAADNIALGRPDRPRDPAELEAAARRSGAHAAISALPQGYETRLGRKFMGGHELSGGEWQRVALARAFYRGGDFLVMDEPTAALDPRAEYEMFQQMRDLAAGKSVLLISHRFANVRMADRIYVLHAGRVVESGSHDMLMAEAVLYAELFRLQADSYRDQRRG